MASSRTATMFTSLADSYHLGAVLRVFSPNPRIAVWWGLLGNMSLLAGGVIAALTATMISADAGVGGMLPLPLLCGLPLVLLVCVYLGAWILLRPRIEAQQMYVAVCEQGLLWCGLRLQIIRWDDIHILWCNAALKEATKIWVQGPRDHAVVIPLMLDEWRTLVRWMERDLTARLFPRALAYYERTHVVCFGPLTLTPYGIVLASRPILLWQEVRLVEQKTMLVLMRVEPVTAGEALWASIPLMQIPNYCVLEAMIKHCVRLSSLSPFPSSEAASPSAPGTLGRQKGSSSQRCTVRKGT